MKYEKFNLDEPIFQMKINMGGLSQQSIVNKRNVIINSFQFSGLQIIYIDSDISNMECIWKGYKAENFFSDVSKLVIEFNNFIENDTDSELSKNILTFIRNLKLKFIEKYEKL